MSDSPRIVVQGLWHLGCVTAACCARHFDVVGLDFDEAAVAALRQGNAPVLEPGLDERLRGGLASDRLRFTTDAQEACASADVLWLCHDTPVNDADESDVDFVLERVRRALAWLPPGALVLVSSQLPVVRTCRREAGFPQFDFACSPENLRLGRALDAFENAERVVVGIRTDAKRALLEEIFRPFTSQVIFMRTESAEMVKHALNSFLAASVAFANEIARLCEHAGADAREVSMGLKSDGRVGPRAYLNPGGPFAGGTLARDVVTLTRLGAESREALALIPAINAGNDLHRGWAFHKLETRLGPLLGRSVAVLGLVYTINTNTLRRSAAVELCRQLLDAGVSVRAFDPAVESLPVELSAVSLAPSLTQAVEGVDAAVLCTEWPQFQQADWKQLVARMRSRVMVDANCFLEKSLQDVAGIEHICVGRAG